MFFEGVSINLGGFEKHTPKQKQLSDKRHRDYIQYLQDVRFFSVSFWFLSNSFESYNLMNESYLILFSIFVFVLFLSKRFDQVDPIQMHIPTQGVKTNRYEPL